ncbi:MAG: peptidase T [Planctomycetota bacterium]|nr:MAG: peptidase T [Planctomycetota bacterium]GDY08694.1 peptidase T [Planctomycetia bacterium]
MSDLLDRFLKYVQIDTQADEHSESSPSTAKQLDLSRLLADECKQMGLKDVTLSKQGVVMATVPQTVTHHAPTIAWVAHVDTSPETSGTNVKPIVHREYDGGDLVLPGDPTKVIRGEENPELCELLGGTIITTDGTTLLGADDKAGIAVIMAAAEQLMKRRDLSHGPIRLVFTCDEEIGRGTQHLSINEIGAVCAYTLDGDGQGKIDSETFSADLAIITVTGINTHPSVGKGVMVNAIRILSSIIAALPNDHLSPETTDGREGFIHPYSIEGGVARAEARLILRDFEVEQLSEYAGLLTRIASDHRQANPKANIDITIKHQYRNMREGLAKEPRAISKAVEATEAAGLEPQRSIIRGGTDGSLLTAMGLPTPNLSTGEHNPHSPLEWTSLEEMQSAVNVLVQLAIAWGREVE